MSTTQNSGGIGFTSILTLIFITLKLLKVIAWSWWWVLSPIWIVTAIVFVLLIGFLIIGSLID